MKHVSVRHQVLHHQVEKKKARGRALKRLQVLYSAYLLNVEKKKARGRALKPSPRFVHPLDIAEVEKKKTLDRLQVFKTSRKVDENIKRLKAGVAKYTIIISVDRQIMKSFLKYVKE